MQRALTTGDDLNEIRVLISSCHIYSRRYHTERARMLRNIYLVGFDLLTAHACISHAFVYFMYTHNRPACIGHVHVPMRRAGTPIYTTHHRNHMCMQPVQFRHCVYMGSHKVVTCSVGGRIIRRLLTLWPPASGSSSRVADLASGHLGCGPGRSQKPSYIYIYIYMFFQLKNLTQNTF